MSPQRIVSLLPSSTEIVCSLGLRDRLVGVSHECDYPDNVVGLPILTAPKLDPSGSSAAIDARVREVVREGLSVYRIDTEELARLRPDLIVTQDQCEVCAVSLTEVEAAVRGLLTADVQIVSLRPQRLSDIWEDVRQVARATGQDTPATEVLQSLKRRVWHIEQQTRHLDRPRVACLEWLEPLMTAGNWIPEVVEIAGGSYPFSAAGVPSSGISWDALANGQPDVIVLMPCGFKIAQTVRELPTLATQPGWKGLPAVRSGRVYIADGNAYYNRPGPRMVESIEMLAEILHPDTFADVAPTGSYIRI